MPTAKSEATRELLVSTAPSGRTPRPSPPRSTAPDTLQTEDDGDLGTGFSVPVERAWERTLVDADVPPVSKRWRCASPSCSAPGSIMTPLTTLARTGLGGAMGPGTEKFGWVHLDDLIRAVVFIAGTPCLSGPVNLAAPGSR